MPEATLTRTVRFSAGHRYWREEWSAGKNRETFGPSARPHGHNYLLEVTVCGPIDPETGFCVDLAALDRLLDREVVERLDQHDVGQALPAFADGKRIPTTEELARWFFESLEGKTPGAARLLGVTLRESDTLRASYPPRRTEGIEDRTTGAEEGRETA